MNIRTCVVAYFVVTMDCIIFLAASMQAGAQHGGLQPEHLLDPSPGGSACKGFQTAGMDNQFHDKCAHVQGKDPVGE